MKTLLFLRHGKTKYTGQFPDLTYEGKQEISSTAEHIAKIIEGRTFVRIVSSPLPRALGTADIIAKHLGLQAIEEEPTIRCMDFYDNEKANAIWASFPNARGVDCAYASDPRFEEGTAIEKRSAIQHRFLMYLDTLFERFITDKLADVTVNVTHYEVLWKLAATFCLREPLIHGEVIRLDLSRASDDKFIRVQAIFRKCTWGLNCKLPIGLFTEEHFRV